MGKTTVVEDKLVSKSVEKRLKVQRKKKDTVSRRDFYEAARTLHPGEVVGVEQVEITNPYIGADVRCCRLTLGFSKTHLSDSQVRELIQVLRDYLSAKGEK